MATAKDSKESTAVRGLTLAAELQKLLEQSGASTSVAQAALKALCATYGLKAVSQFSPAGGASTPIRAARGRGRTKGAVAPSGPRLAKPAEELALEQKLEAAKATLREAQAAAFGGKLPAEHPAVQSRKAVLEALRSFRLKSRASKTAPSETAQNPLPQAASTSSGSGSQDPKKDEKGPSAK